ncbi:MAG: elongation factor 1-beta [Thermoproteota archaeon]|jgi:translation elongation factor 1B (aEF-1B)
MGKVLVVTKVLPTSIDVDLNLLYEEIKRRLPENIELRGSRIEDIAYGLKALKLHFVIPDNLEGGTTKIEEFLSSIEGVEHAEVEFISLVRE